MSLVDLNILQGSVRIGKYFHFLLPDKEFVSSIGDRNGAIIKAPSGEPRVLKTVNLQCTENPEIFSNSQSPQFFCTLHFFVRFALTL